MKSKLTTYLLLTVLIVSQAFASDLMPCESMSHDMSPSMQHAEMSHDMPHDMSQTPTMDCCDQDCACPVGTCVNLALMSSFTGGISHSTSGKVLLPLYTVSDPFKTPLNKPPIYS